MKEYFKGKILEKIELPKRKLTKEEIKTIYNKGKPLFKLKNRIEVLK